MYEEFLKEIEKQILKNNNDQDAIDELTYTNNVNDILYSLLNTSNEKNITVVTDQYKDRTSCLYGKDNMNTCIQKILTKENFYKNWMYYIAHATESYLFRAFRSRGLKVGLSETLSSFLVFHCQTCIIQQVLDKRKYSELTPLKI